MTDKEQPIPPEGEIALTLRPAWWTAHTEHGRMVSFKHPEHGWIGFTLSDGDALKLAALLLQGYSQ